MTFSSNSSNSSYSSNSTRGLHAGIHAAEGTGGVVAAKHVLAAQAGADMLSRGGNAVDAAVATAFAAGVVEPWMSGLGGGGYMVIQPSNGGPPQVVGFPVVAPLAAREDMYELIEGRSSDLFPWPLVRDNANTEGWRAVAVPGVAAGLGMALEQFGSLDLATVLGPAIRLAADGFPVSWHATLRIAIDAPVLARFPDTARTFLPNGFPPAAPSSDELPPTLIVQSDLAETLQRLARHGVGDLYTGETARRLVAAAADGGGLLAANDLAAYQASLAPALTVEYRGWRVGTTGGPTGGSTLARVLDCLPTDAPWGTGAYLAALARTFHTSFEERYAHLGDVQDAANPEMPEMPEPPGRDTVPAEPPGTSTTHVAAADADGMVVSCTQTLLSAFGSRVTPPGTGVLLNNGMYWFDPRPGQPNSIGPGKKPLANMAPLVATGPGGWPRLGLGSSGGRRILSANVQLLLAAIDGGLGLSAVLGAPRIDASGSRILADYRLPPAVLDELVRQGLDVLPVDESPYPRHFASPVGVAAYADGRRVGAADPFMPSGVVAV